MNERREQTRSGGSRRRRRAVGFAGTLLVLALGIVATLGAGAASGSTKGASATFSPGTSAAGASGLFTLTLANTSSSQTLGSANVTIPAGFSVTKTGAWAGSWTDTSSIDGSTIKLRAGSSRNAIAPGKWLDVTLTVTAPCSTTAAVWKTEAKQSNDFNGPPGNAVPVSPQPSIAVTAAPGTARFVVSVANPQAVGAAFTATVSALDACGRPETGYNGTATLTSTLLSTTATPPVAPTVPASVTLSGGTGTASITAVTSQTNATLTATDGSRTGTATFDVANICAAGSECRASDRHGLTSIYTASAGADLQAYFADGSGNASCSDSALRGSLVTIKPSGNVGDVVFTWDKSETPGTGVANFTLCWISDKPGATSEILPKCSTVSADSTCEVRRSRTGVGDLQIVVRITQDPQFDLG